MNNEGYSLTYPFTGGHVDLTMSFKGPVPARCIETGRSLGLIYDDMMVKIAPKLAVAARALANLLAQQGNARGDADTFSQGDWIGRGTEDEFEVMATIYTYGSLPRKERRTIVAELLEAALTEGEEVLNEDMFREKPESAEPDNDPATVIMPAVKAQPPVRRDGPSGLPIREPGSSGIVNGAAGNSRAR